jgi:hypothetical protein
MSKITALGIAVILVGTSVVAWSQSRGTRPAGVPATSQFSVSDVMLTLDGRSLPEQAVEDMSFVFRAKN